jgi:hypothetical protein
MKTPSVCPRFASFVITTLAGLLLSAAATFAADEICASCGQQVTVTGSFAHVRAQHPVTVEGAGDNTVAYLEDVSGANFTVAIAHLPAGQYTVVIGAVKTSANAAGERVFDVTSGDIRLTLPMTAVERRIS